MLHGWALATGAGAARLAGRGLGIYIKCSVRAGYYTSGHYTIHVYMCLKPISVTTITRGFHICLILPFYPDFLPLSDLYLHKTATPAASSSVCFLSHTMKSGGTGLLSWRWCFTLLPMFHLTICSFKFHAVCDLSKSTC